MLLITLLLSLGLQRYLHLYPEAHPRFYQRYCSWFEPLLKRGGVWAYLGGIIIIIIPVAILWLLQSFFSGWLFGLVNFILAVLVLWYCIDGRDYHHVLKPYYTAMEDNNAEQARAALKQVFHQDLEPAQTTSLLFESVPGRLFSGLFWYIIAGPLAVLCYYNVLMLKSQLSVETYPALYKPVNILLGLADWVPCRLLSLGFALAGHFVSTFGFWLKHILTGISNNTKLVIGAGFAAMELTPEKATGDVAQDQQAINTIDRSLILWLVVVALLTLGGWVF